jgi:NADH-quinone oxidoreductase subunit G
MISIYVDGAAHEVKGDQSLLRACLSLGIDVPYFCWHPALESVGACRQCAVKLYKDEKDHIGKIVMSCMTPLAEGMRVSVNDTEVTKFRAANIEWLMLNHPHDCPVCDEGGECHLQDMTLMTGHVMRRNRFKKRTYRNQNLGGFLNHEMNRCIQCYRCVRFYRDYAGGRDLNVFASRNHVYFGRHEDGPLENVFSGNLAEVCPTGVFTDKQFKKRYTRPWDLATAPSLCVLCGLGCNIHPAERYGELRRVRNRFNGEVNGYFLCDRGRYGHEFVNSPLRIHSPLLNKRVAGSASAIGKVEALRLFHEIWKESNGVVAIGSPRASLESNFALRALVGVDRFYAGMGSKELALILRIISMLKEGPARIPSLQEVGSGDGVLVLGEDITNTAPMLALSVLKAQRNSPLAEAERFGIHRWDDSAWRSATQGKKGALFVVTPMSTWLDGFATHVLRATPENCARIAFAAAHLVDSRSPEIRDLREDEASFAAILAESMKNLRCPFIISGVTMGNPALVDGAVNLSHALSRAGHEAGLSFVMPECNSLGLGLICSHGRAVEDAFQEIEEGRADTLIILENDLFRRTSRERAAACLQKCRHVISLDCLQNGTTAASDLVLPAATFAETTGTLVSGEGRAQRFFQLFISQGDIRPSRAWLSDMAKMDGEARGRQPHTLDECITSLAEAFPDLRLLPDCAPLSGFRVRGRKIPREPHRESGRTSLHADITVHEPESPHDPETPLAFTMEGYGGELPSPLIPRFWAPAWNSVQAVNKFQTEVGGPLRGGDPGIRLIKPGPGGGDYLEPVPLEADVAAVLFLVVPIAHIFGSEELSLLAPAIQERTPEARFILNASDAKRLGIGEGDLVEAHLPGGPCRAPAHVTADFPEHAVGVPLGLPGFAQNLGGAYIELRKAGHER